MTRRNPAAAASGNLSKEAELMQRLRDRLEAGLSQLAGVTIFAKGVERLPNTTLFALDGDLKTQPQMVGKWDTSDDKLTYTFELRDGLAFSDKTPVTADAMSALLLGEPAPDWLAVFAPDRF